VDISGSDGGGELSEHLNTLVPRRPPPREPVVWLNVAMGIYDIDIAGIDGTQHALGALKGKVSLVVNVASKCGLTPQYEAMQAIHERYSDRGFSVVGVPCNQFLGQEPGTADEIVEFCSVNYGVSFPLTEKIEVNGEGRHRLYGALTPVADADGESGDIRWNFEKFVVDREGNVVARFHPKVAPDAPEVTAAIESAL
jgi:glutathione peroxidase